MAKYHTHKEINAAIEYAVAKGWRWVKAKGGHAHTHSALYCPAAQRSGCLIQVRSTPRNPEKYAKNLRHEIDACPHNPRLETTK